MMLRHPIWNTFAQFLFFFFFSVRLLLIYLFTCLRLLEEKKKEEIFVGCESVYMFISVRTGNPWIT